MSVPVLGNYQPELPLILVTEASDECVGAVQYQVQLDGSAKPLDYFSPQRNQSMRAATLRH